MVICKKKFCLYNNIINKNTRNHNYYYEENLEDFYRKEKINYYQIEKNLNKYKKFIKNKSEYIPQKLIVNNIENEFKLISYLIKDKFDKNIENQNLVFKKYKSEILQNALLSNFANNKLI